MKILTHFLHIAPKVFQRNRRDEVREWGDAGQREVHVLYYLQESEPHQNMAFYFSSHYKIDLNIHSYFPNHWQRILTFIKLKISVYCPLCFRIYLNCCKCHHFLLSTVHIFCQDWCLGLFIELANPMFINLHTHSNHRHRHQWLTLWLPKVNLTVTSKSCCIRQNLKVWPPK